MQWLRKILDKVGKDFQHGGKFEKLHAVFDMHDTILFTTADTTKTGSHVRDGMDLKRMMMTVVIAMLPAVAMALYNTGYQSNLAIAAGGHALDAWQEALFTALGFGYDPNSLLANVLHGAVWFIPIFAVTAIAGGLVEVINAVIRGHEVNEGFLVTMFLIPLVVPATVPLWQIFIATLFGVLIGKEIFGGTGFNILNPALVTRAFLFFAYPAAISGDKAWIAADLSGVDGLSGATWLSRASSAGMHSDAANHLIGLDQLNLTDAFLGFIPGSMGETSTLACLIGAAILIYTGIGSWRTMLGVAVGTFGMATLLNTIGSDTNPFFAVPFYYHMVLGGWALGTVFMATEPVTSPFTATGKLIYGLMIGVLVVLVRVVNPAYPEGMMLAILFMNMFAPFIDYFFIQANIKRRAARYA